MTFTKKLATAAAFAALIISASACGSFEQGFREGYSGSPATPPKSAVPTGPATTVSDGTYQVDVDMVAGTYKATCPAFSYWARLRSADDSSISNIIANDTLTNDGLMQFTAKAGEYIEVRGCTFTKVGS